MTDRHGACERDEATRTILGAVDDVRYAWEITTDAERERDEARRFAEHARLMASELRGYADAARDELAALRATLAAGRMRTAADVAAALERVEEAERRANVAALRSFRETLGVCRVDADEPARPARASTRRRARATSVG